MNRGIKREKDRNLRGHCRLTVKNAANWLIFFFSNRVQLQLALALILLALMLMTQLSQHTRGKDRTVEYEQEEDEEVDMDNCVMVRHVLIVERLALMIYWFVLCIGVVHCSGAVVYSMGIYVHHHWGYQKCVFFMCVKSCACNFCEGHFLFPVCHCSETRQDSWYTLHPAKKQLQCLTPYHTLYWLETWNMTYYLVIFRVACCFFFTVRSGLAVSPCLQSLR